MRLHYAEVLNPRKVCALAKHLDAPITYIRVDIRNGAHRTPAFRAINPNAKVPVLQDGDTSLWEADAILCHLAMRMGSDFWPRDERQVDVIRWLSWNLTHFQKTGGALYFENVVKAHFGAGPPDQPAVTAAKRTFRTLARVLDDHLAGRDWLVGNSPTIADFSVASAMPFAERAELPIDDCPAILRWHERLMRFDAWRDPYPATSTPA